MRGKRRSNKDVNPFTLIVGILCLATLMLPSWLVKEFPQLAPYNLQLAAIFLCGLIGLIVVLALLVLPILANRNRQREAETNRINLLYRRLVDLSPLEFEKAMCHLFETQGFTVRHSGQTGDGGIDMQMRRQGLAYIGQCKRYQKNPITVQQVREFYGVLTHTGADAGYFITTSRFTKPAIEFAKHKPLKLIDGPMLKRQLSEMSTEGIDGQETSSTK